jgi:Pyruvate flavodoxin/ferredoxin oxidoreductase, thiamine diP-bdg
VHPARYSGHDCTGCGICFYCCSEPGAITVYRLAASPKPTLSAIHSGDEPRQLCKGNVAVIKGAVLAGCRAYYGYPITPASEVAEAAALCLPQVGGTFVQAESETASINMV